MEIKISEKQNEKLSNLINIKNDLEKELEIISIRQSEILEIILDQHNIDIKSVSNVNLENGILTIHKIKSEDKE